MSTINQTPQTVHVKTFSTLARTSDVDTEQGRVRIDTQYVPALKITVRV